MELTKGARQSFQSVGWKTPSIGSYRDQFFAVGSDGKPSVITLKPASPAYYLPVYGSRAVFSREPFPESVCTEIQHCRLLPPPCYASKADYDGQLPTHVAFEPWKRLYLEIHNQALILEPDDDVFLQAKLSDWLREMRAAYEREARDWNARITRAKTASLQELGIESEVDRARKVAELEEQLAILESEIPIDGVPCKGHLTITLEEVKLGRAGIRDAYLHQDWALKNGFDLDAMRRERHSFRLWLQTHTGTPTRVLDSTSHERLKGISPPDFGREPDQNPQFLEACAKVCCRATFLNDTTVYLAGCEVREELTAGEIDELAKLSGSFVSGTQSLVPEAPRGEAIPGTNEKFEYVNVSGTEWRKAGPHMVRRKVLAEHQRTTKDDSTFRKLLEIHPERSFYPTKQIEEVRQADRKGKKRPVAAVFDMTDWDSHWHPPGAPNWKHPGRNSAPNRANQS